MLTSEAWKDLNHASRTVYLILKMQYKGNNPTVKPTYKDFQKYGMNTSTVSRCIEDLELHGFIRCERGTVLYHEGDVVLRKTPNEYTFISDWIEWHYE